jgi:hypothetical protein
MNDDLEAPDLITAKEAFFETVNSVLQAYAFDLIFILFLSYTLFLACPLLFASLTFKYSQYVLACLIVKVSYSFFNKGWYTTLVVNFVNLLSIYYIIYLLN